MQGTERGERCGREKVTFKKIRLPASKRNTRLKQKKKKKLVSNRQEETIARSSRKKKHSSVSIYEETISGQPAKRGTRLCSKQKETLDCQQVRARECLPARELQRERTRVRARERTCMQHKSARQPERVNKRLSKRLACGQAKNNTRLTTRKKQ